MKISTLIKRLEAVRRKHGDIEAIIMHHRTHWDCVPMLTIRLDGRTVSLDAGEFTETTLRYFRQNHDVVPLPHER